MTERGPKVSETWGKVLAQFNEAEKGSGIHSKSEKVCGTAFSVKKFAEKCVNPGVIFGPFGVREHLP